MTLTGTPWTRVDALKAALLVTIGCAVWAAGWLGVSGEPGLEEQIAPMNLAIVGFVVAGAGYASWFLAGRRAVGARRRSLLTPTPTVPAPVVTPGAETPNFLGSERLFHRPDCAMTDDRGWPAVTRAEHERAGRVPCGVCRP